MGGTVGAELGVGDGLAVGVELACWMAVALGSGVFVGGNAVGEAGCRVCVSREVGASEAKRAQLASAHTSIRNSKWCGRRMFMPAFYHTATVERVTLPGWRSRAAVVHTRCRLASSNE